MRIGIVGATGIVGQELVAILAASSVQICELRLAASSKSVGKKVPTHLGECTLVELNTDFFRGLDFCFFCVSAAVSSKWVPAAASQGVVCVDNSSAFRMDAEVPIVVPEVNGELLAQRPQIIANPNCCVAQLTAALHPLNRKFGLEEVNVCTYQSVSGAGEEAMRQLATEAVNYPHLNWCRGQYIFNIIPEIGPCDPNGHSLEEQKIIQETRKILQHPQLPIVANAARVPVFWGHCEGVSFVSRAPATASQIRQCLLNAPNIVLCDEGPQPVSVRGANSVFVGRIRQNIWHRQRSFSFWLVADNLRKGAAHNALSILETWCEMR